MLILYFVGCSGPAAEPTECPSDYTVEQYTEDYAVAFCYMVDSCDIDYSGGRGEDCKEAARSYILEVLGYCEADGATLVDVCADWDCAGDLMAATSDCETASNRCEPSQMFDDHLCHMVDDR